MPKGDGNRKLTDAQRRQVILDYTTPLSDGTWQGAKMLARKYSLCHQAIYGILKRADVSTRDKAEAHAHGKRCKPVKNLPTGSPPVCKCGCGKQVAWNQRKNQWNVYLAGHYRRDAPYKHTDWLRQAHITENRPIKEIATSLSVHPSVISRWLERGGIPLQPAYKGSPGPLNGQWKGGVTPERQRLYKAGHWRALTQTIYTRDDFTCQRCFSGKKQRRGLHAHHLKSWADYPELRFEASNLITLCHKCHRWVHSAQNAAQHFIQ